jgi:arylformamidase
MKYFDITPLISEKLAVYPGDIAYSRNVALAFEKGDHLLLSSITATLHLGAHADAANHYHAEGAGIEQRPLSPYLGTCQVIRVDIGPGKRIEPRHLGTTEITAQRVLFYTGSFPDPQTWNADFCSLSPELIELLAKKGVKLVGIDTPSIDPEDSKKLESHQAVYRHDICVLEGLVLEAVPSGIYTLIALPLPLQGADASPVRAILLEGQVLADELFP